MDFLLRVMKTASFHHVKEAAGVEAILSSYKRNFGKLGGGRECFRTLGCVAFGGEQEVWGKCRLRSKPDRSGESRARVGREPGAGMGRGTERLALYLQPKLNLKVSQRQVLTPGLVQMVSVLALNKLELKDMINSEMIENPVLEEVQESISTLDERSGMEGDRERSAQEVVDERKEPTEEKDPFDEIDFGSYFQDYLDPGFKTASNFEEYDKPSFEHFLAQPSTLSDHLLWQLGALTLKADVRAAAELIVGNLDDNGYLMSGDEELAEQLETMMRPVPRPEPIPFERAKQLGHGGQGFGGASRAFRTNNALAMAAEPTSACVEEAVAQPGVVHELAAGAAQGIHALNGHESPMGSNALRAEMKAVVAARIIVNQLDPVGVGARDLRECLLIQIEAQKREAKLGLERRVAPVMEFAGVEEYEGEVEGDRASEVRTFDVFETATHVVCNCLNLLQKKDMRELTKSCGRSLAEVQAAVEYIRTLDPRPGQRYNVTETRLIEPDVAFVKRDGEYTVLMNEEDMPTLRLNQGYRRMLKQKQTEKEVRDYVKDRYKSAIQLLRNIEQRKNTIVRVCEVIVRRQGEFLERGESALKPMMIKEIAEEVGVHPSTVSRAVANKYVHTQQGVYELRFFFSEGVNGPEGGDLPLVLLKRKVKKLIEDEDSRKPLTDDQLAAELKAQGINVTRRTVAKYREDLQIPSTHQRRVR
jgi:RNA polymerase sigma-54 factor